MLAHFEPKLELSWPMLGHLGVILGHLGSILGVYVGLCWGILGAFWGSMLAYVGVCWPILRHLEHMNIYFWIVSIFYRFWHSQTLPKSIQNQWKMYIKFGCTLLSIFYRILVDVGSSEQAIFEGRLERNASFWNLEHVDFSYFGIDLWSIFGPKIDHKSKKHRYKKIIQISWIFLIDFWSILGGFGEPSWS